jgi:iron complex outermembrane recepter protein
MVSSATPPPGLLGRASRALFLLLGCSIVFVSLGFPQSSAPLANAQKKSFKVAAGDAAASLKQFSQQSGEQIVFPLETVRGITTNAVNGELTAREALDRMLAGTGLLVVQDDRTGAFAIRREPDESKNAVSRRELDAAAASPGRPIELAEYEVTGSRLAQTELEGVSPVLTFNADFITRTGFATTEEFLRTLPQNFSGALAGRPGVPNDENPIGFTRNSGQSGVGLRGLGANNTLVLINGRRAPLSGRGTNTTNPPQGFFDVNTIPVGMIERIEVLTDGASAIYGTDAIAGVVNIILKKHFKETEVRGRVGGTWRGGAFERGITLTHGFAIGRLSGSVVLDWYSRNELFATQRNFSKTADQRPRGGSDFRSAIGQPVTIFAVSGPLSGLLNPNGTPATQAVAPAGQNGRNLTVASFAATAGQRVFFDVPDNYSLITPTERYGVTVNLEYELSSRITLYSELGYTYNDTTSLANSLVTVNGAASVRIPAANPFNPFGQPLGFSISHDELGPRELVAETDAVRALFGARVVLPSNWNAEGSFMFYGQRLYNENPVVDNVRLQALLNETDPTRALNLFSDFHAAGPGNAPGIYQQIISDNIEKSKSDLYLGEVIARGPVWELPAGPVNVATGAEWTQQDRIRTTNTPTLTAPARSRETRNNYAAFAEVGVPVFSPRNDRLLMSALDLQLAARYESIEDAGETIDPKYGARWKPFSWLLLRGSYGTGYRAPALSELERPVSTRTATLADRRRNESYPMLITSGANLNLQPETSETVNFGVVMNIPFVRGLSIGVDYYRKEQENLTTSFGDQAFLDFENELPGRISRGPQTPEDIATGRPGRVTNVDARFVNFGLVITDGYDINLNYQMSFPELGRFSLMASTTTLNSYQIALNPGDPLVDRKGSFGFPLDFKGNAFLMWNKDRYGATISAYYTDSFNRSGQVVGSLTTFDVNVSYELKRFGLRFTGGIGNIFDKEPPFANVMFGYDGGFHNAKQRTYNTSVTYTF